MSRITYYLGFIVAVFAAYFIWKGAYTLHYLYIEHYVEQIIEPECLKK